MDECMFIGRYERAISSSNTIRFPGQWEYMMQSDGDLFLLPNEKEQAVYVYEANYVKVNMHKLFQGFSDDKLTLAHLLYKGKFISIGKNLNITLPKDMISIIRPQKTVCLVGLYDHIAIYSKERYDEITNNLDLEDVFKCLSNKT